MRITAGVLFVGGLLVAASLATAQPPGRDRGGKGGPGGRGGNGGGPVATDDLVAQMMAFDANKDGKLTKDEVTDARLHRLFDRADANKDGVVTRAELAALFAREATSGPDGFPDFPGPGGPGGFGPPGGPPRPGQIMPPFLRQALGLTDDQRKQLDALQKEVDGKLGRLLTDEQRQQLRELRDRGPGGFGPPGFPGGGPPRKD